MGRSDILSKQVLFFLCLLARNIASKSFRPILQYGYFSMVLRVEKLMLSKSFEQSP